MATEISDLARAAHRRAGACIDERRFVDAIEHAEQATRLAPHWRSPWFNLAVAYKHALRWRDVLYAVDRALELVRGDDESDAGLHWNAGIAATVLRDWPRARASWTVAGVELPDGTGPIELELGPTPIRVALDGDTEVLWCDRFDPCQALIKSVPLPESGRRYGDLVVHDGEPRGHRRLGDREVAVFDELTVIGKSNYGTCDAERSDQRSAGVNPVCARS